MKGKGLYFNTRKGYGFIEILSEIDENVPDRSRLVEFLNNPYRGGNPGRKTGLICRYVSKGCIIDNLCINFTV